METIIELARLPRVDAAWRARHGRPFDTADADRALSRFEPMSARAAAQRSQLVPGVLETVAELRRRGMRIGTTTGYTRAIMREVIPGRLPRETMQATAIQKPCRRSTARR